MPGLRAADTIPKSTLLTSSTRPRMVCHSMKVSVETIRSCCGSAFSNSKKGALMFHGTTSLDLVTCLGDLAPVQLDGLELLKQLRPMTGAWFPQVSPEVLTTATTQL